MTTKKKQGQKLSVKDRGKLGDLMKSVGGTKLANEIGVSSSTLYGAKKGSRVWGPTKEKIKETLIRYEVKRENGNGMPDRSATNPNEWLKNRMNERREMAERLKRIEQKLDLLLGLD